MLNGVIVPHFEALSWHLLPGARETVIILREDSWSPVQGHSVGPSETQTSVMHSAVTVCFPALTAEITQHFYPEDGGSKFLQNADKQLAE
jgi:hypothetical protein